MNQQLDQFFRKKLEGYQQNAPANAWDKIEAGLIKKNSMGWPLRIAATVLLLVVGGILLWQKNERSFSPQHVAIEDGSTKKVEIPVHENSGSVTPKIKERNPQPFINGKKVKTKKTNDTRTKKEFQNSAGARQEQSQSIAESEPLPPSTHGGPISFTDSSNLKSIRPEEMISKKGFKEGNYITLVYTVEEVNKKYLDKNSPAQATLQEKKPSTFKKLLNKAYDLKSNQDPFGELRQRKNEILALNFKKEKRGQNK